MKSYIKHSVLSVAFLFLTLPLLSQSASALTFNLTFDSSQDASIVGSGVFSFDDNLADGSYTLDSLTNIVFDVSFINGESFTLADTEDLISEVLAVITSDGGVRRLRFGNINGGSGGSINGSFDFINQSGSNLSFQPGVDGGDFYGTPDYFGNYSAVVVPLPPAILLLVSGLLTLTIRKSGMNAAGKSTVT